MKQYFKLIEQKRQQRNLTIKELCEIVGISEMNYYNAKSCRAVIGSDKFIKLCQTVGIKTLEL